jgi:putative tryptophan/tyrosine transport system substrate-binding protein
MNGGALTFRGNPRRRVGGGIRGGFPSSGFRCASRALLVVACLALSFLGAASHAQHPAGLRHVAVIAPAFSAESDEAQAFREGLREAGYVDGRDLAIDWWYSQGRYDGVPDAVARAVQSKVDVIVVESTVAALAVHRATQSIPVVMAFVGDPVGAGLVESLAHPGGNVTGVTNMAAELAPKRLQLVKEAVPSARRIGVLWNPEAPFHSKALALMKSAAPRLHVELVPAAVAKVEQLGPAFSALSRSKVDAVLALGDPFIGSNGTAIVQLAARARLPLAVDFKQAASKGALIAYWIQPTDLFRRAAGYVDKILKGASPATLPVEQPTKFELVVNLKVAKALGLTISESVLLQANEVIR